MKLIETIDLIVETVDLDQEVRNAALMNDKYGYAASELIQILYHRVCDLESHLIYMTVDEQEYLLRQRLLCAEVDRLQKCSSGLAGILSSQHQLLDADNAVCTTDSWKKLQRKSSMISSEDLYAQLGVASTPQVEIKHQPPPVLLSTDLNDTSAPTKKRQRISSSPLPNGQSSHSPSANGTAIMKSKSMDPPLTVVNPIPPHELEALVACIEAAESKSNSSYSFDYNGNNSMINNNQDIVDSHDENGELFDAETARYLGVDNKFFADDK